MATKRELRLHRKADRFYHEHWHVVPFLKATADLEYGQYVALYHDAKALSGSPFFQLSDTNWGDAQLAYLDLFRKHGAKLKHCKRCGQAVKELPVDKREYCGYCYVQTFSRFPEYHKETTR